MPSGKPPPGSTRERSHSGSSPPVWRHADVLAPAAFLALQFAFFWKAALLRGFLAHSDICYFFEPAKAFMHESLRAGRLPLWSPYIFCGYPIAAEGQIAAFYPPSVLISWLLPSPAAVNWLVISHLILGGVSMYFLCRVLVLPPFGAWLSAFVFSFSGYLFAHIHHVSLVCAAAWLPLVLLLVERAWQRRSIAFAVLAAMAWAASALCGHPQTLFHISLGILFWLSWRAARSWREGERDWLRRAVGVGALVFVIGPGLACVQLLLTADLSALAPHGERGSIEYVTSFSLLPKHLLGLVSPNWQGTPAFNTYTGERYYWEYVLYVGFAPLALALLGASVRRARVWVGFALAALVLALAKGNPVYHVVRFLPGFSEFRAPARYVLLFTFAAAILAGYGWQRVTAVRAFSAGRRGLAAAALLACLAVLDLFWFDRTLAPLASPAIYESTPRVVRFLREDENWGRAFIVPPITIYADWTPPQGWAANPHGWLEARVYLAASVPQSYGLHTIGGYAGFRDPRHTLFFDAASAEAAQREDITLYSLVGTSHFVVPPQMAVDELPAADIPPFRAYRNEASFPRLFAVGHAVPAADYAEAVSRTLELARQGKLRNTAVVPGLPESDELTGASAEILRVTERRPEHVVVQARSDGDVLIVLNERWDPGWRAYVDRQPARLFEVDSVLMGALMPSGGHTVEFLYQPRGLIVGRAVSFISLAACAAILLAARRRGRGLAGRG